MAKASMNVRVALFCIALIGLTYGIILWSGRSLYTSSFDPDYWKERYDQSQWQLPQSPRTLGDDGLFLYEGYALIGGANPALYSAEVPPLGKYLIGLSIRVFGNGHVYGLIVTTLALILVFVLSYTLLRSMRLSLFVTLLTLTDPLIANQFTLTMLDSLQLLLLILFLIWLVSIVNTHDKHWHIRAFAGLTLGLFAQTKLPILAPLLFILGLSMVWHHSKQKSIILLFIFCTFVGYFLPYVPFFLMGHSLGEWLTIQTYTISYYIRSSLPPNIGSVATTLLGGSMQNLFTRRWEAVDLFSPSWPVITTAGIFVATTRLGHHVKRKKNASWLPMSIVTVSIVCVYALIPFWTRYLVIVLPLLYIGTISLLRTHPPKVQLLLVGILLMANLTTLPALFFPSPQSLFTQFTNNLGHGFFRDIYEDIDLESKKRVSSHVFATRGNRFYSQAQIEWVDIKSQNPAWSRFPSSQNIPVAITYVTRNLGSFTQSRVIPFVREHSRWKIAWSWSNLLEGFSESSEISTNVIPARRGTIQTAQIQMLAYDHESILISILPQELDTIREQELLKLIEQLFDSRVEAWAVHLRYVLYPVSEQPVPIGVLMHPITDEDMKYLKSFSGVYLTKTYGRFTNSTAIGVGSIANTIYRECCSLLYTTTTYDGISGFEKEVTLLAASREASSPEFELVFV